MTILQSQQITSSKIKDINQLNLPINWQRQIVQIINDNKMDYEPWVETAKDYNELSDRLRAKGYSNIPAGVMPLLDFHAYGSAPIADTSSCDVKRTMLRKMK